VGRAMSSAVTTSTGRTARRSPRNACFRMASGTRKTVPSAVRPNTTADGGRCSTAIRMNKNELPQMTDVAAKSTAAFLVTSRAFRYLVG
jgi:hypothetical protein